MTAPTQAARAAGWRSRPDQAIAGGCGRPRRTASAGGIPAGRAGSPVGRAWPGLLNPPTVARAATVCLSGATALALLALALTLGDPLLGAGAPSTAAQTALIRRFYVAANDVLDRRDPHALDALVVPDVVVHAADHQFVGAEALAHHLAATGAASPGTRLHPTDLVVAGDRVAATIERARPASPIPGIVLQGPLAPAVETEVFRLVNERIAEYWSPFDDQDAVRALPPLPLSLRFGIGQASLARFAFPPGATLVDLVAPGPHLALPEAGTLTVTADGDAQIVRGDAVDAGWQPAPAMRTLVLRPGDALLVPAGVHHTIRGDAGTGASMLGVLFYALADISGVQRLPTLLGIYASSAYGRSAQVNGAVAATVLARGMDAAAERQTAALTVAWLPLGPGQTIAAHPIGGVELLATETGAVLTGQPQPALPSAGAGPAPAGSPAPRDGPSDPRVVVAGDAAAFSTGMSAPVAAGSAPSQVTLVIEAPTPT